MILTFKNCSKSYGAEIIFDKINWVLDAGEKVALVGPNGSGKTTLLNLITGELDIDEGELSRASSVVIGYFKQDSGLELSNTIAEEMKSGLSEVYEVQSLLDQTSHKMSELVDHDGEDYHQLKEDYNRLQARHDALDGYNAEVRINTILSGMGFGNFSRDTIISSLSGGERTRLSLAKLLLSSPDLMILDEATNHLDFKTLIWLEEYLKNYKGAVIVVSHDRYFLDKVTTKTIEVENNNIVEYPASYTGFVKLKEDRIQRMEKDYEFRNAEIARLKEYHDKNIVRASTSQSAKSRLRMIEHLDDAPPPPIPEKPPYFKFEYRVTPVKDVLDVSNLAMGFGEKTLFENFSMHIMRGERIAIIGENGVGKSTLLKCLVAKQRQKKGSIEWGRNVKVGYFDQDEGDLTGSKTVLDEIWDRHSHKPQLEMRNLLGSLRLTGEEIYKKVDVLSGGERARLKFGILSLENSNVLVLDEPTNHLDIGAKEALDKALIEYDGTVIVVSHDRYLLNHVPTRIIEIFPDKTVDFNGGFDDYMQYISSIKEEKPKEVKEESEASKQYHRTKKQRSLDVAHKKQMQRLEQDIENAEIRMTEIQEEMSSPEVASDFEKLSMLTNEFLEVQKNAEEMFLKWSEMSE